MTESEALRLVERWHIEHNELDNRLREAEKAFDDAGLEFKDSWDEGRRSRNPFIDLRSHIRLTSEPSGWCMMVNGEKFSEETIQEAVECAKPAVRGLFDRMRNSSERVRAAVAAIQALKG